MNCDVVSPAEALAICPGFTPTGPYPRDCANFDQLGVRVPFIAVSPFAKPHYVSHTVGDHTSLLALIEKRFLSNNQGNGKSHIQHLTARDANADPLEDLFDFSHPPSLDAVILDCAWGEPERSGLSVRPGWNVKDRQSTSGLPSKPRAQGWRPERLAPVDAP